MNPQQFILRKLMPRDRIIERIALVLASLAMDKDWVLEIKLFRKCRSNPQNKYLNGVAYAIFGEQFGYDRDDVSEFFCGEYFGWKEKKVPPSYDYPDGIRRVPVRTTTTNENGKRDVLDWKQFWVYVAFVQRRAAEQGVFIPDPDPEYKLHEQQEQRNEA